MALKVGDRIPNFKAIDTKGDLFDSDTIIGKKAVVIYFYPKDNTRVCTEQACSFRDQYEDFKALGAEVIGISGDSLKSHIEFANKHQLPFILLSDSDKKIRKAFGVPNDYFGLVPGRTTYVADKNGIVQLIFDSTSGKIHIEKALEILKTM
ncbi:MAG TPA: peroxiredoxin [Flavobacterium sp.]|uniref:peroxiredoxin n=1 Tax=Flavobacterium sp. TaxID=239 RepID=UPI002BE66209|nr:peroxiredoxin [Flavobacterium sp.]HNP33678.1 peroxiredoxin [Flavobacterium sp.]